MEGGDTMKWKNPLKNNNGSTIIIVIIAMALISMLGTSLLFASYTSYQMKMVERKSKANFYNAESIVNEICMGLQDVVSESIAEAYTDVLVDYNCSGEKSENSFKKKFKEKFLEWKNSKDSPLVVTKGLNHTIYKKDVLLDFVKHTTGVSIRDDGEVNVLADKIILKGVTVNYVKNGYQNTIKTDFVIGIPDFTYTISELILTAVPEFSLIANEGLVQETATVSINGSAYANNLELKNAGTQMTVGSGDTFIMKEGVKLENNAKIIAEPNSSFWAKNIELGTNSTAEFSGDVYVANDLNLKGSGSDAKLAGRYFGFGDSNTVPEESSSIVINGKKNTTGKATKLDMSSLRYLLLAGHSFIGGEEGVGNAKIRMGESISVKPNQIAYLIPVKCMKEVVSKIDVNIKKAPSNPMLFESTTEVKEYNLDDVVDLNIELWKGKKLSDYCNGVQVRYNSFHGNKTIVSFYMKFDTREKANIYFRDYFSQNTLDIERYLGMYTECVTTAQMTKKNVSGNTFSYNGVNASLEDSSLVVSPSTSERIRIMFTNLCTTLSSNIAGKGSVYDYIVDTAKVSTLDRTTYFQDTQGKNVAVITRNSSRVSDLKNTNPNLCIIVSTDDLIVDEVFSGLIITNGAVTVKKSISANRADVFKALTAKASVGGEDVNAYDYLKVGAEIQGSKDENAVTWNVENLVTYENWKKN